MKLNIQNLMTNWKTTTMGVALVVGSIAHIAHNWRTFDENGWTAAVTGLLTGLGFIYAADSNSTPPPTNTPPTPPTT